MRTVADWPGVVRLREEFAAQVRLTAELRQEECECPAEMVYADVRAAAARAAEEIGHLVLDSAEMALDLWAATR